jgi:hypothetical protein
MRVVPEFGAALLSTRAGIDSSSLTATRPGGCGIALLVARVVPLGEHAAYAPWAGVKCHRHA